jgi:hypothetical protein
VVKATGLSNNNPLHRLVGVAVIDGDWFSVTVGVARGTLAQETIKNIPMNEINESVKGRSLRDSIVAPLIADIKRAFTKSGKKRGASYCEGSFLMLIITPVKMITMVLF